MEHVDSLPLTSFFSLGLTCFTLVCVMCWVGALEDGMLPVYTARSPGEWPAVALELLTLLFSGPDSHFSSSYSALTHGTPSHINNLK